MEINLKGAERLTFVGTATSHFQAQPRMEKVTLDWEYELDKNLRHADSHIRGQQNPYSFPDLLDFSSAHADRSVELGMNMFRFSIELGRLSPRIGEFDQELMARYVGFLAELVHRKQTPMITLQHYTMPNELCRFDGNGNFTAGAWEHPDVISHLRYAVERVVEFLCDPERMHKAIADHTSVPHTEAVRMVTLGLVSWFITINEPVMTPLQGYLSGLYPPYQKKEFKKAWKVMKKMVEAHDMMYGLLKQPRNSTCAITNPQVGVAHNWTYLDGPLGWTAHKVLSELLYSDQFERDGHHSDFLGIQYYFRETPPFFGKKWRKRSYPDHPGFGDVCPQGILEVLKRMHRAYSNKKIIVTEFGFPDNDDQRRPYWIMRTFLRIIEAARLGIPVIGALHWSLADNFEWDWGMDQHFGLMTEKEALRPLRLGPQLRGWQAWQACAAIVFQPSKWSTDKFMATYARAESQFKKC